MNTSDPSFLGAERLVQFNGNTYAVNLSSGDSSLVRVIKRNANGEYRQTIKPDSQNWKRAVRLAREQTP
jgi:hypothetical protein